MNPIEVFLNDPMNKTTFDEYSRALAKKHPRLSAKKFPEKKLMVSVDEADIVPQIYIEKNFTPLQAMVLAHLIATASANNKVRDEGSLDNAIISSITELLEGHVDTRSRYVSNAIHMAKDAIGDKKAADLQLEIIRDMALVMANTLKGRHF